MDEIKQTFFQECDDLLEALEAGLLVMNDGTGNAETVNEVFRAVHSIKGGAGAFGLEELVNFAHIFETTLDELRSGRAEATPGMMKVLLRSSDVLADLVRAARDQTPSDAAAAAALVSELETFVGTTMQERADEFANIQFKPVMLDFGADVSVDTGEVDAPGPGSFEIRLRPKKAMYAHGNEVLLLLRELAGLGECDVSCDLNDLPNLDKLDGEDAYLGWTVTLLTDQDEAAIREVFEFVDSDCDLDITPPPAVPPITAVPDDNQPETDAPALAGQDVAGATPEVTTPDNTPVADAGTTAKPTTAVAKPTIRVDLEKVDRLINLVGELVINQSMLAEGMDDVASVGDSSVAQGLDEFKQLTRQIQESVMAVRAQPVKPLFQRMSRIVREAAHATGKSVQLKIEGEATEVDKIVVERLADPLTHMIRNAVDHGLETPEKRREAGKDERGEVCLSAAHRSGKIVITISDDGTGINRARVRQIAVDKNLIDADAQLTNSDIDNLLFLPGFSTVETVSELSGRGVGMDVVKRSIQTLGGSISISSKPGLGSTFRISLPLTLAVLDGMVVKVAGQTLIVPLTAIVETLVPDRAAIHGLSANASVLRVRGRFLPIIDAGHSLSFRDPLADYHSSVALIIETDDGAQCALLVDEILDQRQVVIKSLEENYGYVAGIAAATILGDGRIALIIDTEALVARAGADTGDLEPNLAIAG